MNFVWVIGSVVRNKKRFCIWLPIYKIEMHRYVVLHSVPNNHLTSVMWNGVNVKSNRNHKMKKSNNPNEVCNRKQKCIVNFFWCYWMNQKVSSINMTQINMKQYSSSNWNRYLENRVLNRWSSGLISCDLTF